MGREAAVLNITCYFMNFFNFPWQKRYIDRVDYSTGPCIFPGNCVHKSCYFQTEVNLWEARYSIYCEAQKDMPTTDWLLKSTLFSCLLMVMCLLYSGRVCIWQQLHSCLGQMWFWILEPFIMKTEREAMGFFYTCHSRVNSSWYLIVLWRKHNLNFALDFVLVSTLL